MEEVTSKRLAECLKDRRSALIVVDVQNDFCDPRGAFGKRGANVSEIPGAVDRLLRFMDSCRQIELPIVFVRTIHSRWTDSTSWLGRLEGAGAEMGICREGSWGAEFYRVERAAGDYLATKHRFSGFVGTDLDLVLRTQRIETLLMTGVATNVCVESTARDGFNRDYRIVLVEDCCGAFSPEEHASTVRNIARYFGVVSDWRTVASALGAAPSSS